MIRWRSAAVSSSVQSGRMCGSKAGSGTFTCNPSVAEGVLDFAERGGYRRATGTVATPLDGEKSTSSPTLDALRDPTRPAGRGALERRLADRVGNVAVTKGNQVVAEHI